MSALNLGEENLQTAHYILIIIIIMIIIIIIIIIIIMIIIIIIIIIIITFLHSAVSLLNQQRFTPVNDEEN